MNKKHIICIIVAVALLIPIVFWISSLIKCEVLTHNYYDEFAQAYAQNSMLDDIEDFKVLDCDGKTAEVYYVSKGMTDANILTFEHNDGYWVETSWETVWSTSGSASGVVYPYWWHFIYGF